MWLPIMEPRVDANLIANIGTNLQTLNRDMYAIMERTIRQAKELEKLLKEQYSRQLPSDIKNDSIWESENVILSLEDECSSSILDEDKDIIECDKMTLVLEEELKNPTFVEKCNIKKNNLLALLFYLIVLYAIINFILFICYFIGFK